MRKRDEFRQDTNKVNLLQRFHMTRAQRRLALMWFLFALCCTFVLVLQDTVFSQLRLWGARTDLLPCALLMVCVLQGAESGGIFATVGAILYYFSGSAPGVYVILLIPLLGTVMAVFRQGYLRKGFRATLLCASVAVAVYELGVFLMGLLLGQTLLSRVFVFIMTAGLSVIALPFLYPILQAIGKIGGETWKE